MNLAQINKILAEIGLPLREENPKKREMKKRQAANRAKRAAECQRIKTLRTGKAK